MVALASSGVSDRGRSWALPRGGVLFASLALLLLLLSMGASATLADRPSSLAAAAPSPSPLASHAGVPASTSRVATGTSPLSSSARSLQGALRAILPTVHRPAASPIPNITGTNITGFVVSPLAESISGNSGLQMMSAISAMATGANSTTYMFSILGEEVSSSGTAFVGYLEGTFPDFGTIADPLYLVVNGTTLETCGVGGINNIMMPGATIHSFTMEEAHGLWWTFTADGKTITGGSSLLGTTSICSGNGNGTVDLGASSVSFATIPIYAWLIPGNVSGVVTATIATVAQYDSGGLWTDSQIGELVDDSGIGVEGYSQNSIIPPDRLVMDESFPILAPATFLWDTGPLPSLTLAERGVGASMAADTVAPFKVWVNGTGGTASVLAWNSTAGKISLLGAGPTPGEDLLSFRAPVVDQTTTVTITLNATASGYVGAQTVLTVKVAPGKLSVGEARATGHVLANATLVVPFWVNSSFQGGTPAPVSPGQVVPTVRGGGEVVPDWTVGSMPGYFPVEYTAPLTASGTTVTLTLSASGPGFIPATANLTLSVWPQPLALEAPATASFSPGTTVQVQVPATSTTGSIPGGAEGWWNVTVAGSSGSTPLSGSPQVFPAGTVADVELPISASYVGPLTLSLSAAGTGYNATSVSWSDNVVGAMEVSLSSLPTSISGGDDATVIVTVTSSSGAPLPDSLVVWSVDEGSFQGTSSASAESYTGTDGTAQVTYVAPSVGASVGFTLKASVSATYYTPASAQASSTIVPASSNGFFSADWSTGSSALLAILVLIAVVLVVLIVVEHGRQSRVRRRGPSARGSPSARASSRTEEGVAPVPGAVLPDDAETPTPASETEGTSPSEFATYEPKARAPDTGEGGESPSDAPSDRDPEEGEPREDRDGGEPTEEPTPEVDDGPEPSQGDGVHVAREDDDRSP